MELDVRHLRAICAIADTGSLTRAAAVLGMSQPGLTAALHRMERVLGGALFSRDSRGSLPTALGELVVARARAILPAMDDLRMAAALTPATLLKAQRIGACPGPLLSGMVNRLHTAFPDTQWVVHGADSFTRLTDLLAAGRFELAIFGEHPGYAMIPRRGIKDHCVATEPLFALLSQKHPLAQLDEVPLGLLATHEWALPPPDADRTREYYAGVLASHGLTQRLVHEVDSSMVLDLVRDTGTVGLGQAMCRLVDGVVSRPIAGTPLQYRHMIAWHAHGPLAEHADLLIALAAESYAEAVARLEPYQRRLATTGFQPVPPPAGRAFSSH